MAMKRNGSQGFHEFRSISIKDMSPGSLQTLPDDNDESPLAPAANGEPSLPVTAAEIESVSNSGTLPPKRTGRVYGKDPWWVVGLYLIAASSSSYVLGYPYLIMARLGWIAGPIIMFLLIVVSIYKNCLLGSLHETGGQRRVRTRDLVGYIYAVWVLQATILFVFGIGTLIWGGTSLQLIYMVYADHPGNIGLSVWIAITGIFYSFIAFLVPNMRSFRLYTAFSFVLTMIIAFIAIGVAIKDGLKSGVTRDYSLVGSKADKWFNAMGALSIVGFGFTTAILPELQASVKSPTDRNIYKSLAMQYTIGTIPVLTLGLGAW